jgi:hypothetical protein
MDEVDGMAGNEDRGGVAELINLIKITKVMRLSLLLWFTVNRKNIYLFPIYTATV